MACARLNLGPVGGTVHEGDLFDALPDRLRGRLDRLFLQGFGSRAAPRRCS